MYCLLFLLLSVASLLDAKHLPSYIKACKKDDPDLRACCRRNAIAAIPNLLKGDKEYKIPPLVPFHISLISLNPSDNLSLKLKDTTLTGLETVDIKDINFDLKKKHVHANFVFSRISIIGEYEIDGRILVLPIQGTGPANITTENMDVHYSFDYNLMTKRDGKVYFDPNVKSTVSYTPGKNYYHFGNLFNGDKTLGEHTNQFLNEHQKELHEDLKGSLSETINVIVTNILKSIISEIPYDEIFL